jgi:hypothetical protein
MPYSSMPYQQPSRGLHDTGSWYQEQAQAKPAYQEDPITRTGGLPRAAYPDYDSPVQETSAPAYPASWGAAPDATALRPEFRSGPRARFSR